MARPLRIEYPGALYHITSRGNQYGAIYRDDEDREEWLRILAATIERYQWECYAYCLMGNHYHLLVETPFPNLSLGMRMLNGVYTQAFNRRHRTVGHLYQGRFKSILVEKESYLLELSRYIVLNPVRAKLVNDPAEWEWSSYLSTVGKGKRNSRFLAVDKLLSFFGSTLPEQQKTYARFVHDGIDGASPWEKLENGYLLGSESLKSHAENHLQDQLRQEKEIAKSLRNMGRPSLEALFQEVGGKAERNDLVVKAHTVYGYTQKEIASSLGLHYASVSRIVKQGEILKLKT